MPKRTRTERSVPAWFTMPMLVPDVAADGIDGRVVVRENEYSRSFDLPVLGGRLMAPLVTREKNAVVPMTSELFEARIDGTATNTHSLRYEMKLLIDPAVDHATSQPTDLLIEKVASEAEVLEQMKEPSWSTRTEAEEYARYVAAELAVIDGVVHHALVEPIHVYDLKAKTRSTRWDRLSSWSQDHEGAVVARADRFATNGNAFDEGFTIEGDADTVAWRYRDADANALQIARFFFDEVHLSDFAAFHGHLPQIREYASGIANGRADAAGMLLDTVEDLLKSDPGAILKGDTDKIAGLMSTDKVRSTMRLVRSIRHAQDEDERIRMKAFGA
jgi:hypothetical protein